jgi:hypothetical protein
METMRNRLTGGLFIAGPCFLALLVYDWIAVVVLGQGPYRLVPWHDLARGAIQDLGLTAVYALTVTPRVSKVIADNSERSARLTRIMLGLGLAWYAVICAWMTRALDMSPDLGVSIVLLFIVPVIVAPWYVRWLKTKMPRVNTNGTEAAAGQTDDAGPTKQ